MTENLEIVRGSGNVFRDLGHANADVEQAKALLAAEIVGVLADRELSTRKAQELTGVNHSEFARIRKAKLDRFTIDRLVIILNRLGQQVDVGVSVRPDGRPGPQPGAAHP
jgi:predicted XRE-type DNA-binding protein